MSLQSHRIDIQGDGNAIGNNNQITVIKQDNRRYSGGPRNGEGGGKEVNPVIPAAISAAFLMAAGTYYFAIHANSVYTLLLLIEGSEALLSLMASGMFIWRNSYQVAAKAAVVAAVSTVATLTTFFAHNGYPVELTSLAAASSGVRDFWCGLSVYGRQLALLHAAVATLGMTPATLLLLPAAGVLGFFSVFPLEVTEREYRRLENWTSWGLVIVASLLAFAASYAHSTSGWNVWTKFIGDPPSIHFCPNRK